MAGDSLHEAISAFQDWRRSRGIAAGTLKRDRATLISLERSAGPRLKVSSLTTAHIDAFFLERSALAPQTQNLDLSTLRVFCTFLETRGFHRKATNLLVDYRPLKYAPEARRRVPVGEFPALLDSATHPRDRMVIALGLYLFLRASEIRLIRVQDVSLATDEVSVRVPKTRDSDIMPISAELARELRSWLTYYSSKMGQLAPDWFLVPTFSNRSFHRDAAGRIIAPLEPDLEPARPVSIPERVVQKVLTNHGWPTTHKEGVHTLRRSGARALYDELAATDGHSNALETVSAMLHHKIMATTQVYLGLTESRRKRDRIIAGRPMFPSLSDPSVTPLRQGDGTYG